MLILKIFRAQEWQCLKRDGATDGAPIDLMDGYIHFSTSAQAPETAAKYFADEDDLVLVGLNADALGSDLKWEPARGGALFPHLYRAMTMADVDWHCPLPKGADGVFVFPEMAK